VQELLRDFSERDPNAYHRLLWANHFCYAETYEVALRFGPGEIHPTRRLLFEDLETCLATLAARPADVGSVFEVGSSLGYNLRFLETRLFSDAKILEGCDIDEYAVTRGNDYLRAIGSKVRVTTADMSALDVLLGDRCFDVTLCAGVLMYLNEAEAERVVAAVLRHTGIVAAFAGLADPERDNATLPRSGIRSRDRTFIHNIDAMVSRVGGCVLQRRWDGPRLIEGNTVYFVFATKGPA
jgi:SAM-dependent methyltransferase